MVIVIVLLLVGWLLVFGCCLLLSHRCYHCIVVCCFWSLFVVMFCLFSVASAVGSFRVVIFVCLVGHYCAT